MFSRQHYDAIAKSLAKSMPTDATEHTQWRRDITQLCDLFKQDNPRFDSEKFFDAVQQLGRLPA